MSAVVYTVQLEEGGQEMTFTDDDLKQLKDTCDSMDGKFESWNFVEKDGSSIGALLARLEAAEAYAEIAGEATTGENYHEQIRLHKAWRKAAGK